MVLAHMLRTSVWTYHASGQVARSAVWVQATRGTLRSNYHVSGALRFRILLLHSDFLLLHHLLLKMWMHLNKLLAGLLRNGPRVTTFAWMLSAMRRGSHLLLMLLVLLHVVIVATVNVLNVHNILVFFILSVIFIAE